MHTEYSYRLLTGAALIALTTPFSQTALAQDTNAADKGRERNTIVVTASRREQSIADVQASIDVVTSQEIGRFPGASVTEALRQSVGVDARTSGANSTVALRGQIPGAGSAVLFLFDGLPRTGKFGVPNLNTFPVEDVEQVEIIRGPMSALYGANASGGVVNVITKPAGEGAPLSLRILGGTTLGEAGEGRETIAIGASGNFKTGDIGHRISLDWRNADPYRFDASTGEDDLLGIDHLSLTYTGQADLGTTGSLRWTLEGYFQDDRGDSITRRGTSFERFEKEDRYYGSLAYSGDVGPGTLSLEASHGFSDGTVNRSFPGPNETTEFTQSLLQGRYGLPLGDHYTLIGAGVQRDKIDVSILTSVGEETNLFAFIQNDWNITDNIKLIAGLRLDDFDAFGTQIVPRISIGSRGDGFTWRAGYGEAFRAPSVIEQFASFRRGPFLITGSPDVAAEESKTWEAAIGWRGARGSIEIVYHDTKIANLIQTAPNGQMLNGLIVLSYQNIEKADIAGVELSGTYDLGQGFSIDGSYEYLDAEDGDGERLTGRARHAFKAAINWQGERLGITLRGRHLGSIWGINPANRRGPAFASDYTVADMQIGYQISDEIGLAVGVENMFDERTPLNWSRVGQIEDPPGRYAYASLRFTLGGR